MTPTSAASVRLLAAWLQERRALTDRVESLLLHGPTAVDRVGSRAHELREAYVAELRAFDTFVAHVRQTGALPLVEPVRDEQARAGQGQPVEVRPDEVRLPDAYPPLRSVGPTP